MKLWQIFILGLLSTGQSAEDSNISEEDDKTIVTWLTRIERFITRESTIDVCLPQTGKEEHCRLLTPDGHSFGFDDLQNGNILDGVKTQNSSDFVSCRITIGPLTDDHLGDWTLIGSYEEEDVTYETKQVTNIRWHGATIDNWRTINQNLVEHVVNFGGSITPTMTTTTTVHSCYVVTPNGEDLILLHSSNYPNITRLTTGFATCRVELGPIHNKMLGDWMIYGIFGTLWPDIIRRPLHLYLYDEENPYDQAYNRTMREHLNNIVNLNTRTYVEARSVTITGEIDSCHVKMPNGVLYDLNQSSEYTGVTLEDTETRIACRIGIGPIVTDMLGDWTLIGRFSNRGVFTEVIQSFSIIQEDPRNPIEDDRRNIEYLNDQFFDTNMGEMVRVTIDSSSITADSCHIRTPDGLQYILMDGFNVPGVEIVEQSDVVCGVDIKLISEDLIGNWTLISRETHSSSNLIERRLPFTIYVEGHSGEDSSSSEEDNKTIVTWLEPIDRRITRESTVDLSLYQTGKEENCRLLTPDGHSFEFDDLRNENILDGVKTHSSSDFVSCRITIGPLTDDHIGEWTLIGSYEEEDLNYERKQVTNIQWHVGTIDDWEITDQNLVEHVVNFGGSITPTINGVTVQSCHIVTPNGEDLLLLPSSNYPNITRIITSTSSCRVELGPIHNKMLGDWMIYGIFGSMWPQIIRRPLHLYLYDEDNPYDQAYNRTIREHLNNIVNLNARTHVEVTSTGETDSCHVRMPNGILYDLHQSFDYAGVTLEDTGTRIACRISIGPIVTDMLGDWTLIGRFSNRGVFTEVIQSFSIIQEDPRNPIEDDRRNIQYIFDRFYDTHMGEMVRVTIDSISITADSCHIRTPDGLQYILMDGFNVPGVEIVEQSGVVCGVDIKLKSEYLIGNWTLISRETHSSSNLIERRLPFTISVEEFVTTIPKDEALVATGNDFFIRLENPTNLHDTCKLVASNGDVAEHYEFDTRFIDRCGFIVRNINPHDSGIWEIVYGRTIIYRAPLRLNVQGAPRPITNSLVFTKDRAVDERIGPDNAIYCRAEDSRGIVWFSGFSVCHIVLDRAKNEHAGRWTISVVLPGHMLAVEHVVLVTVNDPEPGPRVTTYVQMLSPPAMLLSCSVSVPEEISACKFRDPQNRILMASPGLGEGRYTYHGTGISEHSGMYHIDCGIQINYPSVQELGLWRCAIETTSKTYFGFLTALCPWSMEVEEIAAMIIVEPVVKASRSSMEMIEGDSVTMSCMISAPIRYCYFRSQNGTIITVNPGMSTDSLEYVGAGFEAGECGIRLLNVNIRDSGLWTCNIATTNVTVLEQHDSIDLTVARRLLVQQFLLADFSMTVGGRVHNGRSLEHCRFIRSDGFGFNTDNMPLGYENTGSLQNGECLMIVRWPSIRDQSSWMVVAKIKGQEEEISVISPSVNYSNVGYSFYALVSIYIAIIFLGVILITTGVMLVPKKNRQKTFARAASIRNSLGNSFRKKPVENVHNNIAAVTNSDVTNNSSDTESSA